MKSSSSLSDVCTSFISIVKAKLFWKIFLSGGEFTEKENVWGKDVNEKNRVVIPDKNLEADNCHWIEQELRRLQTWEVFLIKSSSKSTLGLIRILLSSYILNSGRKTFLIANVAGADYTILQFSQKESHSKCCGESRLADSTIELFLRRAKKIWTSLFCTDADMSQ